ncbi:hypothetical protein PanWU01x14_249820 [Parasponia andersonii]|uniref:Uncharacterized protein n=1 Tax=Parasponia andersonii TaxID=3476 RepID=A0A2P5BD45_PARAD|nr:hypothetical protein PanWU01x14_249820 [Parasponia andersonii]
MDNIDELIVSGELFRALSPLFIESLKDCLTPATNYSKPFTSRETDGATEVEDSDVISIAVMASGSADPDKTFSLSFSWSIKTTPFSVADRSEFSMYLSSKPPIEEFLYKSPDEEFH